MEAQMSETNEPVEKEVTESRTSQETIDYKALYEKSQEDLRIVAEHKDKLYKETKQAKADRELADLQSKKVAEEKAQKDGEFEKLWNTSKQEKADLEKRLQDIEKSNRSEKVQISAMRIATELADGDNAELLSEFVQRNLDKMADEAGGLSPDVLEAVKNEFKSNGKFKALLRGSKAAGGGATGNTVTKAQSSELSRAEFAKLSPLEQGKFFSNKQNKLTD
jgi:DNA repair exonuclease SbcCD nuclease subunit